MISIEELFELISKYLFAFKTKEEALDIIFPEGIDKYKELSKDLIVKLVNKNITNYFKEQFENKRLSVLLKGYIYKNNIKELKESDISIFDNLLLETGYELEFEDLEKIYEMKEIKAYISKTHKEESFLVEQLKEFEEDIELGIEYEEERNKKIKPGQYSTDLYTQYRNDTAEYMILKPEEERYYLKKYQEENDEEACAMLILCNQGLIRSVARRYENRGLERMDLIQEGNIGMMTAIKRFDLSTTNKLSTYSMHWIRQAIKRAIGYHSSTIRIPVNMKEAQDKLTRIENTYINEYGEEPTLDQLVELTGFTKDRIKELKKYRIELVSFNKPTGEDGENELGDFIKSDIEDPSELAIKKDESEIVNKFLDKLATDTREKEPGRMEQVIRLRFGSELYNETSYRLIEEAGLEIKDAYTLEDISKMFHVCRERIRQIEAKGIKKLNRMKESYNKTGKEDKKVKQKRKYTRRKKDTDKKDGE